MQKAHKTRASVAPHLGNRLGTIAGEYKICALYCYILCAYYYSMSDQSKHL